MLTARRLASAAVASGTALGCSWLWARGDPASPPSVGPPRALSPGQPLLCALESKQRVSSDVVRLRFALPSAAHTLGLPVPGHVMVVDAATNYRPYSPITIDARAIGFFELLVRHYPAGEFSSALARMQPGDAATFVGPVESRFGYSPNAGKPLGLVAAGTGITPIWQVIQAALADPADSTSISLVYASRTADDILLKEELDLAAAEHPDQLRICYLVSRGGGPLPEGVQLGRIDEPTLRAHLPPAPDPSPSSSERVQDGCQLLVCGPEPMVRELCGPRARDGSASPGPGGAAQARYPALGGLLRKLGYRANQVVWL